MASNGTQKFVHYLEPGGLVLIESIEPGMTLYGLSKKYNVSLDSILEANPDLNPGVIPLGFPVNIPIYAKALSCAEPEGTEPAIPLYYRVQPKETLYRISRVYLEIAPEQIVSLNPRVDKGLSIGQVILLGWYTPQKNTHSPAGANKLMVSDSSVFVVKDYNKEYKTEGRVIREQKGLAVWKPGNMQSHFYVLHPTATVGSFIEVTNPMLQKTLTAKVAGNIPPGLYPTNVGLVVSPSVARALGVLDQQFFARWKFVE
jgi:LysM repeat protein